MTWQSLTCFSIVSLAPLGAADVSGKVELADSRDVSVTRAKDYSNVVAWLQPAKKAAPMPRPMPVTLLQKNKRFTPHVIVVQTGTLVDFPNADPIFHNAFSNFAGQPFDTGLYAPGTTQKITFRREGVVRVFCNIHSNMSAVILVLSSPYFARTDRFGVFKIPDIPAGEYTVRYFHERATESMLKALERKIAVGVDSPALPPVRISEAGYLPQPHKNKLGMEYPPLPADNTVYPGAQAKR